MRPSTVIAKAFSAGFHLIAHRGLIGVLLIAAGFGVSRLGLRTGRAH